MPELLLELFSEEIPARMQGPAARDLERLVTGALVDRGLLSQSVHAFVTPRRLGLVIEGLPARQPDMSEERKGPRVDGPPAAIQGFLKSTGLTRDQLTTKDDPKGAFYLARIERKGRPTTDVLAEILPQIITSFPWPKSMRWGAGELRWVRPLHRILCVFDGAVVPFVVGGIESGDETEGHRFLGRKTIRVRSFSDHRAELEHLNVMIDPRARRERILEDARAGAFSEGLRLVEDDALLEEVAGLVEWPVVLIGRFEEEFLALPEEVLMTTMRTHQKYFSLRDAKTDRLANRFVTVSNMLTEDGGTRIIDGNARVIRARLSDARFFYEEDKKVPLGERVAGLEAMVFHARLGSVRAKVARMEALAADLAERLGTDVIAATEAAHLAKADLVTGMVGEFPELQGVMGGYYAAHDGKPLAVSDAIREHYSPLGPTDRVPSAPVSICVALADKLDTLTGFWAIDEKPTGSKDPYALRRAALGIIRIVLENDLRVDLESIAARAGARHRVGGVAHAPSAPEIADLLGFFADRLKVYLRERGARHDLIDAVFASGAQGDLWLLIERVKALAAFLSTDDGASLLALYRRAGNIVAKEEKKDKTSYAGAVEPARLVEASERTVYGLLSEVSAEAERAVADERFGDAMAALARLRAPVDDFFEHVTVNADDAAVRRNRLHLLATIKAAIDQVADFSKIEG